MTSDRPNPGPRLSFMLRLKTAPFIEEFPTGGILRTISRAGLNGMRAIERGRKTTDSPDSRNDEP